LRLLTSDKLPALPGCYDSWSGECDEGLRFRYLHASMANEAETPSVVGLVSKTMYGNRAFLTWLVGIPVLVKSVDRFHCMTVAQSTSLIQSLQTRTGKILFSIFKKKHQNLLTSHAEIYIIELSCQGVEK
jgi:hypothetical protein